LFPVLGIPVIGVVSVEHITYQLSELFFSPSCSARGRNNRRPQLSLFNFGVIDMAARVGEMHRIRWNSVAKSSDYLV